MLGYTRKEQYAETLHWRRMVHVDDIPGLDAALAAHSADASRSYEAEYRMRHRAGHWVWLQRRGRIVARAPDGTPSRMLDTMHDMLHTRHASSIVRAIARWPTAWILLTYTGV